MDARSTPVGLDGPLTDLRDQLDRARTASTCVLVDAPAGAGLTTLLQTFVDGLVDPAVTTHRARGLPWEATVSGAVVDQLVGGRDTPGTPEDLVATLDCRVRAATVVVVDDAHHADVSSVSMLASAVRHQPDAHLLVVLGRHRRADTAPGLDTALEHAADVVVHLHPLGPDDVAESAARLGIALRPSVAARLTRYTGGLPRAVHALLRELPRDTWARPGTALPAPRDVADRVLTALEHCDDPTRRLVETVAVLGAPTALPTVSAIAGIDDPLPCVDVAVTTGLVSTWEGSRALELDAADPMVRAAVLEGMSRASVAAMHRVIADVLDDLDDRPGSLAHRARAAALPDAELADDLTATAHRLGATGEWGTAATLFDLAARMSRDPRSRETTFLRGVDARISAGDIAGASDDLAAVESLRETPLRDSVLGYLAILRGRPQEASARLGRAWDTVRPAHDPEAAAMICHRQVLHSLARCDGRRLVRWADEAVGLVGADHPVAVEVGAIRGLGLGATGRMADALAGYDELGDHNRVGPVGQRVQMGAGWLHLAADDLARARAELESAIPTDHLGGSTRIALWAHSWLARTCFATGDWPAATRTARAGLDLADRTGTRLMVPLLAWTLAQIAALRGDESATADALRLGDAGAQDYEIMRVPAALARAAVAEARADYPAVVRALSPLTENWAADDVPEPGFWPWPDVYANALVMQGRLDDAEAFLEPHERRARDRGHRSAQARLAYARGRLLGARGDIDAAVEVFDGALATLADLPLVYDRARVEFAYGQTLRRAGRRRDADVVITDARDRFHSLGASAYVRRCERELKAGGVRAVIADRPHDALTPQEEAVATLVATGMTNREAAAELFLSVKTVQYHLTRVYAKLGVRSRAELAALRGTASGSAVPDAG
jgi:DNA-binding CsgD family transcriptional regulator